MIIQVIAFISCMFVWLFAGFYMAMSLHHSYMLNYYMSPPVTDLDSQSQYDIQLTAIGEPFSKASGVFQIRRTVDVTDKSIDAEKIIYHTPLMLDFDSEEYEGTHQAMLIKEFTFSPPDDSNGDITFTCLWEGEFEHADFHAPTIQVVMKKSIPHILRTWANPFGISPFICLIQILINYPDRSRIVRVSRIIHYCTIY
jgi:hypothetical protein